MELLMQVLTCQFLTSWTLLVLKAHREVLFFGTEMLQKVTFTSSVLNFDNERNIYPKVKENEKNILVYHPQFHPHPQKETGIPNSCVKGFVSNRFRFNLI